MRILMIEDDKELAEITKLRLEKDNFTVDVCLDGAEGLYYMQENMYDLVILDRMLPSMDGTQVLKEELHFLLRLVLLLQSNAHSLDFHALFHQTLCVKIPY